MYNLNDDFDAINVDLKNELHVSKDVRKTLGKGGKVNI